MPLEQREGRVDILTLSLDDDAHLNAGVLPQARRDLSKVRLDGGVVLDEVAQPVVHVESHVWRHEPNTEIHEAVGQDRVNGARDEGCGALRVQDQAFITSLESGQQETKV